MNTAYPSLELCRKLTEIRFPKTEKVYSRNVGRYISGPKSGEKFDFQIKGRVLPGEITTCQCKEEYPCPSVMEMLDVMPKEIPYTIKVSRVEVPVHRNLVIGKNTLSGGYYCKYVYGTMHGRLTDNKIVQFMNTAKHINGTLPNALAEMILWLVENNYISFTN